MHTQRRETLARQLDEIIKGVNALTRRLEECADCLDLLTSLQVVRVALNEVKIELLSDYLERWATAFVQDNDHCKEVIKVFEIFFDFEGRKSTTIINHTSKFFMR